MARLPKIETHVGPVVIPTTAKDQRSIICFDGGFTIDEIRNLINDIENVRQTPGFSEVDLYFSSRGGYLKDLSMLADYLNNIDDFKVNFICNDMCASCGFFILLEIDNENVRIRILESAYGVIHLATQYLDARDMLGDDFRPAKFYKRNLDETNKIIMEKLSKCGLTDEELKRVKEGEDIYLDNVRLEKVIKTYIDYRTYEDGSLEDSIKEAQDNAEKWIERAEKLIQGYERITGKKYGEPEKKVVKKKSTKEKPTAKPESDE